MSKKEFSLEEYKLLKGRIETHEKWYYQMLILSFSGFIAILGISDKITDRLIPFMISPFLLITSLIALGNRQLQSFETAYLIEKFDAVQDSINFEKTYLDVFINKQSDILVFDFFKKVIRFFINPFIIINILGILTSLYFGYDFVRQNIISSNYFISIVYVTTLMFIYLIIFTRFFKQKRLSYYQKLLKE